MQEDGKLHALKDKWWIEKNEGAGECGGETAGGGDTPELGMEETFHKK